MDVQVVQCDGRGHVDPSVSAWAVSVVGTYGFDTAEGTVDPSLSDAENAAWMLTKIVANNDLRGRKTVGFMDRVSRVLNAYPSVILRIEDVPVGKKLSKHCLWMTHHCTGIAIQSLLRRSPSIVCLPYD